MSVLVHPHGCRCTSRDYTSFPTRYCDELEVSMVFPSCWDGVSLDSPGSTQHVAVSQNALRTRALALAEPESIKAPTS